MKEKVEYSLMAEETIEVLVEKIAVLEDSTHVGMENIRYIV